MKPVLTWIALSLSLLIPAGAGAGPDRFSILLGSEHNGATREFQEFNPGLFLTWEENLNYSIGLYYNSYEEISPLVSVGYDWEVARDFDLGAFFAIAVYPGDGDEFRYSLGDVVPFVGLQARYRNFFVQFIPADGDALDSLFTFGLTFALD
ncbi:MAG: hypothetical protein V2I76_08905 [Roseobacter sp.]|nr:hypothetical protein [Roseobacter sp.]